MWFEKLEKFQNDEIIKDKLIRDFEFLEWVLIWVFWNIAHDNYYEEYIKDEEKKVYEMLYEIKDSLNQEGLNLSLLLNRVSILIDNFIWNIPYKDHWEFIKISGHFIRLGTYLETILKDSWVDTDVLSKDKSKFAKEIEKIIYSK